MAFGSAVKIWLTRGFRARPLGIHSDAIASGSVTLPASTVPCGKDASISATDVTGGAFEELDGIAADADVVGTGPMDGADVTACPSEVVASGPRLELAVATLELTLMGVDVAGPPATLADAETDPLVAVSRESLAVEGALAHAGSTPAHSHR
jgi:hypothetical protein